MIRNPALGLLLFTICVVSIIGACGGSSTNQSPSATDAPEATESAVVETTSTTEAAPTATEAPVATAEPSTTTSAPELASDIRIEGSPDFIQWTNMALELIATQAPEWFQQVTVSIETIVSVPSGSGINVFTKTYMVGDITAYAPDFTTDQQLIWYAGTIVHDSCHSERYENGLEYSGKEGEVACLGDQKSALELLDTGTYFTDYVQGLIDGADEPENAYWTNPNRHW